MQLLIIKQAELNIGNTIAMSIDIYTDVDDVVGPPKYVVLIGEGNRPSAMLYYDKKAQGVSSDISPVIRNKILQDMLGDYIEMDGHSSLLVQLRAG